MAPPARSLAHEDLLATASPCCEPLSLELRDPACFCCQDCGRRARPIEIMMLGPATPGILRDQKNRRRRVLRLNDHKTDLSQLSDGEYGLFSRKLRAVARALTALFHPGRISRAICGDLVPRLFARIVPRRKVVPQRGSPFSDSVPRKILSDEEHGDLVSSIREEVARQLSHA